MARSRPSLMTKSPMGADKRCRSPTDAIAVQLDVAAPLRRTATPGGGAVIEIVASVDTVSASRPRRAGGQPSQR
jgi:hypothetical protein